MLKETVKRIMKENANLKVRELSNGKFVLSSKSQNCGLKLSCVCTESTLKGSISGAAGVIYDTNNNSDEKNIVEELQKVVNMYKESCALIETEKDDLETQDDDKEILLDDENTKEEPNEDISTDEKIEIVDDEETTSSTEEKIDDNASVMTELSNIKDCIDTLAEKTDTLLGKFDKGDYENKLLISGLVSTLYSVSENIAEIVDDLSDETESMDEGLCVPTKTSYIDLAQGAVSKACTAIRKTKANKDILDVLKDIRTEMILRK